MKFGLGADLYELPRQWVDLKNEWYIPGRTTKQLRRAYTQWIESGQWSFDHRCPPSPASSQPQQQNAAQQTSAPAQEKAARRNGDNNGAGVTLHFDKYEGKTLQQVLQEDPDYVAYLADKAYDDTVRQAAASMVQAT